MHEPATVSAASPSMDCLLGCHVGPHAAWHACEREMQNRAAAGGRAIFASGSPQPDVEIEGRTIASCQGDAATPLSRFQALPTARRRQAVPADACVNSDTRPCLSAARRQGTIADTAGAARSKQPVCLPGDRAGGASGSDEGDHRPHADGCSRGAPHLGRCSVALLLLTLYAPLLYVSCMH